MMSAMTDPMTDLRPLVDLWWSAVADFTAYVREIEPSEWHTPTDLAGWDVAAIVAHVAHLEAVLAGTPHEPVDIGEPAHVANPMGTYTEQGVVARRERTRGELVEEIDAATTKRHDELLAALPAPGAPAPDVFGLIGWDNRGLLSNRPLDVWMHEQDLRRATGRPGGLAGPVPEHVIGVFQRSLGYVVGKRTDASPGDSVRLLVEGCAPVTVLVADDGRAAAAEVDGPTTTITLDREAFIVLAGGRRSPDAVSVAIAGDTALGRQVVAGLAVTP
jgi:uncharacterized protein (TIGR03083 family)